MALTIVIPRETAEQESRVALVPESVKRLTGHALRVLVEPGAGTTAGYPDEGYEAAGARLEGSPTTLWGSAQVLLKVQPPSAEEIARIPEGAVLIAQMNASRHLSLLPLLQQRRITTFALELLPRISRAQGMDVLSSQATVAGYRALLIGATLSPKFLPMLTTAAGTIRPARVLVLGAGVAGLMAIATAHRMGAVVEGYDVRRAAGEQVRSLGAKFLELPLNAEGAGGYARELTPEEKKQEAEMVAKAVGDADIVVTTAAIPGRKAPVLVRKEMVERMRPGSVLVDLAAETGGNCELTQPGQTVQVGGVTLAGPLNLPSQLPFHASQMYSKNLEAFLGLLVTPDGSLVREFTDEILAASLLTRAGEVVHAATRAMLSSPGGG